MYALETHGSRVQSFVPTVLLKMPPLASGFWRAWNSMLPFSLWGLTPQGLQTLVPTLLLKQSLWGSCNTTLNPCSRQKLLFFLPSIRKLSWAPAGNFLAWQLRGQISKFWPAARNDYVSIWDSFANPSFLGLATFGQDFKVRTSSLK